MFHKIEIRSYGKTPLERITLNEKQKSMLDGQTNPVARSIAYKLKRNKILLVQNSILFIAHSGSIVFLLLFVHSLHREVVSVFVYFKLHLRDLQTKSSICGHLEF